MIDAQVRLEALNARASFIMEAPAGSGKTEVLVRRMLSLLLQVDHPNAILAITFTRKACAEMKERLHQALFDQNLEGDAEKLKLVTLVRERVIALGWTEADLNGLSILTIDALCARILMEQGLLRDQSAEILPEYAVLGDALMLELLAHLQAEDEYSEALRTIFLYFGNQIEQIKTLLLDILNQRVEWLSIFVPRQGKVQSLNDELQVTLQGLHQILWKRWNHLQPHHFVQQINTWLHLQDARSIKKIASLLLTKQGDLRKRFDASLGLAPELRSAYLELIQNLAESEFAEVWILFLRELSNLPDLDVEASPLLQALVQVLPLIAAHWQMLLTEHHYRDFQEDALQAVLCLSNNDPVSNALMRFERELKHILVDEFQDTSRLQFRMLEQMTQTWQVDDGRTLFLVGDPMQSIYRFRDARVELFLEARERGIGQIRLKPLRLLSNFRTDASVLDFINVRLQNAFPQHQDVLTGAVCFSKSVATRRYADACGVQTLVFDSAALEASALTEQIKDLLARDGDSQIALLTRSRSHLQVMMQYLIHAGIAIDASDWGNLLDAMIIDDLVSLTFCIHHLGDRLAWLAFLRSPMVNLDLDELFEIARASQDKTVWEVLLESLSSRIVEVVAILRPLIFNSTLLLLVKVQRAFVALTKQYHFSVLQENMIVQYWEFLSRMPVLSSYKDFNRDLRRLKLNYENADARVHLLTIHQAKGLEFDYVFLPHLNQGVRRSDPPLLRWGEFHIEGQFKLLLGLRKGADRVDDPVYQYLSWLSKEEAANEQVRLLYVALTRAKKGLFLSYFKDPLEEDFKPRAGSFLKLLNLSLEES